MMKSLLLVVALSSPLLAQSDHVVTLGDRVRIIAPETGYKKLVGRVVSTTPDALSLHIDGSVGEFEVQRADILSISRSTERRRNTKRGAGLGLVIGAFTGIFFGPKASPASIQSGTPEGSHVGRNALVGGLTGVAVGTFVGFLAKTDYWTPILAGPRAGPPRY